MHQDVASISFGRTTANFYQPISSSELGVIGAGTLARQQLLGIAAVRQLRRVRIHSRSPQRAAEFARFTEMLLGPDVRVEVHADAEHAIANTDIIATATASFKPVAEFNDLLPHVHINCMGAHTRESREVPLSLLKNSVLVVEDRHLAIVEAGDVHCNALDVEAARKSRADLAVKRSLFSSTGHAFYDLLTTAHILRQRR